MKRLIYLSFIVCIAAACNKNDDVTPQVSIDITVPEGGFAVDKLQWLKIAPTISNANNATILWKSGEDTLSTEKDLLHAFSQAGSYELKLIVKSQSGEVNKSVTVTVKEATYANEVNRVFEYFPAPGQFINKMPGWSAGMSAEQMAQKAQEGLKNGICLGSFGGYVIMGTDHVILNKKGARDFTVLGNAFANNAEPGVIMVSYDANGNGLPDDEWYEIAGSEHTNSKTIKNYEITYYKPDEAKTPVLNPDNMFVSDMQYIKWTDNKGNTGYVSKNTFHSQSYYPQWKGESITFKGTLLPDNAVNTAIPPDQYWQLPSFAWGYADNQPNNSEEAKIDIDWAIDKNGNPVKLKGINFIKVYTGVLQEAGWLGETSTEVFGVKDLNL